MPSIDLFFLIPPVGFLAVALLRLAKFGDWDGGVLGHEVQAVEKAAPAVIVYYLEVLDDESISFVRFGRGSQESIDQHLL